MSRRALVLFALALTAAPGVRAQTITVQTAGGLSSLVGMPFDVPIVADWNGRPDRLGSFALTLRWNPAVLRFESGTPGSFGSIQVNTDSTSQGVLKLAGANPAGANGIITLGIGRFTPLAASTTAMILVVDDIYSIAPDFTNLVAFTTMQGGLFCPARGRWGDPDGDGVAGSRDALIALSEAVGLDVSAFPQHDLADVDADAAVKARDALIILSGAVGLDVSAYRLLRIAVGSCGSDVTTAYTVTPTAQTLVARGETQVHFELRATSGGAVRTLPDVFWRSSDPTVIAVLPDGRGIPVGVGSAVITGKSGRVDSATAVMTVVARRSRHVVDALAISSTNRLGTLAYPYASLPEASNAVSEGDTIIVRPGRYDEGATFGVGVVVLGQSVGPANVILAGTDNLYGAALSFSGGARAEVHNVNAERVGVAIAGIGVDTLVVDSLRYLEGAGYCGDYAIATTEIWRLEVRRSDLRGGGVSAGCAAAIGVNGAARMVLVEDVKASDFGNGGISALLVDSAIVRRTQLTDNAGYSLDVGASRFGGSVEVPLPTSTVLVLENSRVLAHAVGGAVNGDNIRGGHMSGTLIDIVENDALYLSGTSDSSDRFDVIGDTIQGRENYWFTSDGIDTVRVDGSVIRETQDGFFGGYRSVQVTNTLFDNVVSGEAMYFQGDYVTPVIAMVDNVTIRGEPGCFRCNNGLVFYGAPAQVSRLTASNLYNAVELDYTGGSVTHSNISNAYAGIYVYDNTFVGNRVVVRGDTISNVQIGVQSFYSGLTADSLDMTGGVTAVQTSGSLYAESGADTVRNSTIRNFDTGIDMQDSAMVAIGNTVIGTYSYPLHLTGNNNPLDSAIALNNTLSCVPGSGGTAFYSYGASYRANGNAVSGCSAGFYLTSSSGGTAEVRGNSFVMPADAGSPAITVPAPLQSQIVGNDIRGGGNGGGIWVYGYSYFPVTYARVDSNTIHGVQQRGIWFEYVDSAFARGNLIDSVATTPSYSSGAMGIGVFGGNNGAARLVNNRVRHVQGHGIFIDYIGAAVVALDSNAVSTSDTSAVRVATGFISMTGNNIRNNPVYGLWVLTPGVTQEVHGNAFQGNGLYAAINQDSSTVVNADGNWWGAAGGPGTAGADSVLGLTDNAPLATSPAGLPALSAPAPLRTIALAPIAPTTARPSTATRAAPRAATPSAPAAPVRRVARAPHRTATRAMQRPALPPALSALRRAP
jgi:hypothetical protein